MLAIVLTPAVLVYAWGRTLIQGMMTGHPDLRWIALLAAGIVTIAALTWRLSDRLNLFRWERHVPRGVLALWIIVNGGLIWFRSEGAVPRIVIVLVFIPATLWVVWMAWMFYRQWSWSVRLGVLLGSLPFVIAFPIVFRADGLTGGNNVIFAWRNAPAVDHGADLPTVSTPFSGDQPDLTQTTPDDYPQFLGPNRTGVVTDKNLSADWNESPPREVWRKPVGAGWSAFAVVGDFAVTQEQRGSQECVVCYRVSDGKELWVHGDAARFTSELGGLGPRATPTIADGRVYTVGATGILNCLDGRTGIPIWSADILKDSGGGTVGHGVCGSPLVTNDRVIVAPTGIENACLAAYNRQTGKRVWLGGRHRASYGSPAIAELAGVRQLLLVTADGVEGNDYKTGKPLWSYTWSADLHVNCSQPIIVDADAGKVLYCTGYDMGSVLLHVSRNSSETWSAKEIWKAPVKMKTKFTTAVIYDGHAYGLDDGILACLNLASGKQVWKGGRYQHGQILLAGNLLIVQAENGEVVLVKPDPKKLIELGRIPALSSMTWNNPALSGRILLVRNDREAACYELPVYPSGGNATK